MSNLEIFSGKVRLCEVGLETKFRDVDGKKLFTGDVVVIYTDNGALEATNNLSAVVAHEDGTPFVMGIANVNLLDEPGYWRVLRIKSHEDVIAGEHWSAWGFSYREKESVA